MTKAMEIQTLEDLQSFVDSMEDVDSVLLRRVGLELYFHIKFNKKNKEIRSRLVSAWTDEGSIKRVLNDMESQ